MMTQAKATWVVLMGLTCLFVLSQSIFTVQHVEQVLVMHLGKPLTPPIKEPGWHFKIPFVQDVRSFDNRPLALQLDSQAVRSMDKKTFQVDSDAHWRIVDLLTFFQRLSNESGAIPRLEDIVYSAVREVLGQYTMREIAAGSHFDLMTRVRDRASTQAAPYGVEIVDVRIQMTKRAMPAGEQGASR